MNEWARRAFKPAVHEPWGVRSGLSISLWEARWAAWVKAAAFFPSRFPPSGSRGMFCSDNSPGWEFEAWPGGKISPVFCTENYPAIRNKKLRWACRCRCLLPPDKAWGVKKRRTGARTSQPKIPYLRHVPRSNWITDRPAGLDGFTTRLTSEGRKQKRRRKKHKPPLHMRTNGWTHCLGLPLFFLRLVTGKLLSRDVLPLL